MSEQDSHTPSRWQRREKRRTSERERMKKHGASFGRAYRNALLKRMRARKRK